MKRIQHYATYLQGGAGGAAVRIFEGLKSELQVGDKSQKDWEFEFFCRQDQELSVDESRHFVPNDSFFARTLPRRLNRKSYKQAAEHYHQHLKNRPADYEAFSPARLYEPTALNRTRELGLIHLHWVAFLVDYLSFFKSVPSSVPLVWTLHDMNAFTGGCHYSAGCEKYKTGCGNCFQLDNPHSTDLSAVARAQKKKAFANRDITIVTPCQWLTGLARESQMFSPNSRFETIHYGLDTSRFFPLDKQDAKAKLGLAPDKTTLLFGAADLSVKRKGWSRLLDALCSLPSAKELNCVIFGGGDIPEDDLAQLKSRMDVHLTGFIDNDEAKRNVYSAGDLFVLPSLEDNQPQTGLESMACGTPVVAYDTGGISEFVLHGKTGLLASIDSRESLAKQINWLVQDRDTQQSFGQNARDLIVAQFEIQTQSEKYIKLYDSLLTGQNTSLGKAA